MNSGQFDQLDYDTSRLGEPVAALFVEGNTRVLRLIFGCAVALVGIIGLFIATMALDKVEWWIWVIGILWVLAGITWIGLAAWGSDYRVLQYSNGFRWESRERVVTIMWEDIAELSFMEIDAVHGVGEPARLVTSDRTEIWLGGVSSYSCFSLTAAHGLGAPVKGGAKAFATLVCQKSASRKLPDALEKYSRGESIPFGSMSISAQGVHTTAHTVAWTEIKEISFIGVRTAPRKVVFARTKDHWELYGSPPSRGEECSSTLEISRATLWKPTVLSKSQSDVPDLHVLVPLLGEVLKPIRMKSLGA